MNKSLKYGLTLLIVLEFRDLNYNIDISIIFDIKKIISNKVLKYITLGRFP